MIEKTFWSLSELVEKDGIDADAARQAIAENQLSAFVELSDAEANWRGYENATPTNEIVTFETGAIALETEWSRWRVVVNNSLSGMSPLGSGYCALNGWFRIAPEGRFGVASANHRKGLLVEPYPRPEWFAGSFVLKEGTRRLMPKLAIHKDDVPRLRATFTEEAADKRNPPTPTGMPRSARK